MNLNSVKNASNVPKYVPTCFCNYLYILLLIRFILLYVGIELARPYLILVSSKILNCSAINLRYKSVAHSGKKNSNNTGLY